MEQSELEEFPHPWGGGTCIEIHLPMSLKFDGGYYVLMDLNCFTAQDGKVSNYTLTSPEQWAPKLTGEYGVSGLYYCTATAKPVEDEEFEEGEEIEEGEELEELEEEPTEAPSTSPRWATTSTSTWCWAAPPRPPWCTVRTTPPTSRCWSSPSPAR